jgi:hypothetical protein
MKMLLAFSFLLALAGTWPMQSAQGSCGPWVQRFLNEWKALHPEEAANATAKVEVSAVPAEQRLNAFRQGLEGPAVPVGEGTEGRVFTNLLTPDRALKIWKGKAIKYMAAGVDYLVAARAKVQSVPELASRMRVVQVYERGPGWIVREYIAESRPLQEAFATDPLVRNAVNDMRRLLPGPQSNGAVEKIRQMITRNPISPNLHWDPATKQIVLIDGF